MALKKAGEPTQTHENGTAAAVGRLNAEKPAAQKTESPAKAYAGRDFDKEARGKSLCLLYGHAIGSALIAGMKWEKREEAFEHMKFYVNAAMKEIFPA